MTNQGPGVTEPYTTTRTPTPEALAYMRAESGSWYAYEALRVPSGNNVDAHLVVDETKPLMFLPSLRPPPNWPWRFEGECPSNHDLCYLVGKVNLETGLIEPVRP